ncbi:MAG: sensor domain-containing diguanylate cyclase [Candidatus Omnitrophota bacterium]|nr:sensor domain-containing diguanylate cyclase [Candidatus Omnitrophota bacterium]
MLNLYTMDTDSPRDAQEELQKVRGELSLLYEISNAMRTTLKLDEILYIILTAVTAHVGLGFNRAMLFLVNEKDGVLEGKMGIGPDSGEEANRIWTYLEKEKTNLDNLISNYKISGHLAHSQFDHIVKGIRLPLKEEEGGILAMTLLDGMPLHITQETIHTRKQDTLINILRPEEFVTVPLKAKDKIIGVLFVDNPYTHKPITKDNIRILTMFANQAGLAIENSKLYEQTLIKSHTDSLTSLWNHGYFQSRLQEEVSLAQKNKQNLSIIMADLDNFKVYNDTLGHQEGDQILIQIAKILNSAGRKQDTIYRYGGEEFAILLLQTDKQEAHVVAEKIRNSVEQSDFRKQEIFPNRKLTISLGIATYPDDAASKDSLLEHADKALYSAKHQGKNRVCG